MLQRGLDSSRVRGAYDDRHAAIVRIAKARHVVHVVEDERFLERNRRISLDRDLGHLAARRAEPAFSQSWMVSPGAGAMTSTLGASFRSSSGVPAKSGNVP